MVGILNCDFYIIVQDAGVAGFIGWALDQFQNLMGKIGYHNGHFGIQK